MFINQLIVSQVILLFASTCLAATRGAAEFMNALSIPPGVPSTNVYAWTPPRDVRVQGAVLSLRDVMGQSEYVFNLVTTGNLLVADCCIGRASTAAQAVHELCEVLVSCVDMPVSAYARAFCPTRDMAGDVIVAEMQGAWADQTRCHRTAGNLYLSVRTYTNAVPLNAEAVADALLSTRTAARE